MKPLIAKHLQQVERRLLKLRAIKDEMSVRPSWIKYIRRAYGMSLKTLAKLMKLSLSTVAKIESREVQGKVTVETLKKVAEAMDCDFIYAFVPRSQIQTTLEKRAYIKAKGLIKKAKTHMALEDQEVSEDLNERISTIAKQLISKGDVW